jgi:chromosome segregation ATPase
VKDYIYLAIIAALGSALVYQVFNPPECPLQQELSAIQDELRNCRSEQDGLKTANALLNNQRTQAEAQRDAAKLQADQAEGKVEGLNNTITQRTRELNEQIEAFNRLKAGRDQLLVINQRINDRLSLLKALKQQGSERSQQQLDELLAEDIDGFLVWEGSQ